MQRLRWLIASACCLGWCAGSASAATGASDVALGRLDCGTGMQLTDVSRFSDTSDFAGLNIQLTFSCYLIKHGDDYMIWDTGNPPASATNTAPTAPKVSIVEQLAALKVKPEQVKFVGISHYHGDHTGQLPSFPQATLLIGKGDWDAVSEAKPGGPINTASFTHWISEGGKVEPLPADKDVFGDGSVIMLNTPGHTPGHHSLLVRLKDKGNVMITGDLAHFRENYDSNGVPTFNTERADTLASLDRFKKLAANIKATVIIQHDARDVGKLPVLPAMAK